MNKNEETIIIDGKNTKNSTLCENKRYLNF